MGGFGGWGLRGRRGGFLMIGGLGVMESLEDIILWQDRRGMLALRPYLPGDFCGEAGRYVFEHPGHTVIVTGFYVLMAGRPETDGPPGAVAIGNALRALGRRVTYVTDRCTAPVLRDWAGGVGGGGVSSCGGGGKPGVCRRAAGSVAAGAADFD